MQGRQLSEQCGSVYIIIQRVPTGKEKGPIQGETVKTGLFEEVRSNLGEPVEDQLWNIALSGQGDSVSKIV